jgi:hypothetical protein
MDAGNAGAIKGSTAPACPTPSGGLLNPWFVVAGDATGSSHGVPPQAVPIPGWTVSSGLSEPHASTVM